MTKVKNQVINTRETIYTDTDGDPTSMGDQYRNIATVAEPQKPGSDVGVVRKSGKGRRPAEAGWGGKNQMRTRLCFKECARFWADVPDNCASAENCWVGPTKESIFK